MHVLPEDQAITISSVTDGFSAHSHSAFHIHLPSQTHAGFLEHIALVGLTALPSFDASVAGPALPIAPVVLAESAVRCIAGVKKVKQHISIQSQPNRK